ncbi:hypothetical protein Poli38472_004028 [Pythium oligandrum]|uniref:Protein kinase domain-containing protein n=1 Tax=Pythium oligandrum TaxID=41045 RepID=A0A8K1CPZ6_PYTOL|nr:hypothetical protein Poli38472_004028 [Pythium oligandrum]|eukprot:TMW66263.1 hypothetical protein Poli38472_004028 [Pythium oligandrum]
MQLLRSVSAAAEPVAMATTAFQLPRLPVPPIFDPPLFSPIMAGLFNGSALPGAANMTEEQIHQTQMMIAQEMIHSAKSLASGFVLVNMLGALLKFVMGAFLLAQIRRYRQLALRGDVDAAKKIILPAFEPLLWVFCGAAVPYFVWSAATINNDEFTIYVSKVVYEITLAWTNFLLLLVLVFMLQSSLSTRALVQSVVVTFALSTYVIPIVWLIDNHGDHAHQRVYFYIHMGSRLLLLLFLGKIFTKPPARATVRTLQEYCVFVAIYLILYYVGFEMLHQGYIQQSKTLQWITISFSLLCPVFIWRVLRADTEHWRGIGKRAVELQAVFRRNGGRVDERVSSQGLHVLIEMHRKFIIDFAHLELHETIGTGDSASVFRGFLHSKKIPVAVKIYMPTTFTEETVAEFSHEAALCGALRHPNILKFYGLCVCPPNICLVTELCQGSLRELLLASAIRPSEEMHHRRQQFLIDLGYMIDAARAVAYLHSFSPPFVHRDIQPSNFLVNMEGTVKLTDFGASRTLALRTNSGHQHQQPSGKTGPGGSTGQGNKTHPGGPITTLTDVPGVATIGTMVTTPEYMAPEVIRAQHAGAIMYAEAAEVFALSMTMWDVLHPGMAKYSEKAASLFDRHRASELGSPTQITLDRVVAGERPPLEADMPERLQELIESMWQTDPRLRPTMPSVVSALELIQEEAAMLFAQELMGDLGRPTPKMQVQTHTQANGKADGMRATLPKDAQSSFAGTQAVEKLRMRDYVETQSEAIRIGNLLMDAGFLHHVKHARSFEYSGSQYYFDEDHIQLCQPLAMMEDDEASVYATKARMLQREKLRREQRSGGSSNHEHRQIRINSMSNSSQVMLGQNSTGFHCPCRQLGQRLETERATRRRFHQRFKVFTQENMLTARLLTDDQAVGFAAFDDTGPRANHAA